MPFKLGRLLFTLLLFAAAGHASAAASLTVTIGLEQSGTAQWELAAMHNLGIDKSHDLEIRIRQLADNQAGEVALQTGAVDIILSDFVWVSLQRARGNMVTMVPYSVSVGGLLTDPASGIGSVTDLAGKTLAIAGTPVDKSWVVLQAYYNKVTGRTLTQDASVRFGAPPLVNQLLVTGQVKEALNNWNWNARAELAGQRELISVRQMLASLGVASPPPLLGWVFTDANAAAEHAAIAAFLDASFDTSAALRSDDLAWDQIRDLMNVRDDDKLFAALREGYRQGIVLDYDPNKMDAAVQSFALFAKYGGKAVVGDAPGLSSGTFYQGYTR